MRMVEFADALAEALNVDDRLDEDERWTIANNVASSLQPWSTGHKRRFLKMFVNRDNELQGRSDG